MQKMECSPAIVVEGEGPVDEQQEEEENLPPPTPEEQALLMAIRKNDLQTVKSFIANLPQDFDINNSINGSIPVTPLCLAASMGLSDMCHALLANILINFNQVNPQGETPLLVAIKNSNWHIAEMLLEKGADPNKPEPIGHIGTPLFNAVWRGSSKMVRLLLKHGADVNLGSCRSTPIFMAARLGCFEITKILLDAGCDKDNQYRVGETPLYEAVSKCHVNIVRLLLDCGCDPNIPDTTGLTPLHIVAQKLNPCDESKAILQLLIEGGADVTLETSKGETAADVAIGGLKDWVLKPILEKGAALNLMVHSRDSLTRLLQISELEIAEVLIRAHPFHTVEPSAEVVVALTTYSHIAVLLILSGTINPPLIYSDNIQNEQHRKFLHQFFIRPMSLQIYCRIALRRFLGLRTLYVVRALKLPKKIEDYILLNDIGLGGENSGPMSVSAPFRKSFMIGRALSGNN